MLRVEFRASAAGFGLFDLERPQSTFQGGHFFVAGGDDSSLFEFGAADRFESSSVEFDIPVDGFEFCGVVVALIGGGFELPVGFFEFGSCSIVQLSGVGDALHEFLGNVSQLELIGLEFLAASSLVCDGRFESGDRFPSATALAFQPADTVVELTGVVVEFCEFRFGIVFAKFEFFDICGEASDGIFERVETFRVVSIVIGGEPDPPLFELFGDVTKAGGFFGLVLGRVELGFDLVDDISEPEQVLSDPVEFSECFDASGLVSADPGGFFEDGPSRAGVGLQDGSDTTLFDDTVGRTAGAQKQVANVLEPAGFAVDQVFAVPVLPDPAPDLHFGRFDRQQPTFVIEGQRRFGESGRLATRGSVEDDVGHLLASHALGALVAENPLDCVDDVALAAPVGSDDPGDIRVEVEPCAVDEALEAEEIEGLEHPVTR